MSHIYSRLTKCSPWGSKLRKLSKEYLSPQKTQKAAVFFIQKNLDLKMNKNFNKFKNTYYICTHCKSLNCMESPLPKCIFLNFSFALGISKLFINEDSWNFYHGWVRQRPFKFHIRNRVSCSSPLPRAASEKVRVPDFLQKKA